MATLMTANPVGSSPASAGPLQLSVGDAPLSVRFRVAGLVSMLGSAHPAIISMLRVRFLDLVTHHRLTVGKNAKVNFPGGRSAQNYVYSRIKRWAHRRPLNIEEVEAQSRGIGKDGDLAALEHGRAYSGKLMAIPTYAATLTGTARVRAYREFNERLRARRLDLNPATGELTDPEFDRVVGGRRERRVVGVLRRRRYQRPLLGFYRALDQILPRHWAKLDKDRDIALTAAGRETLVQRDRAALAGRDAARAAYAAAVAKGKSLKEARRIRTRVAYEVRKNAVALGVLP